MTKRPALREVQRALDRHVLQRMEECRDTSYDRTGFAFYLDFLASPPELTRDMVRAVCRSLTDRGYCFYMRGLFNSDGEVAGAGYGITDKGAKYLDTLLREDEVQRAPATDATLDTTAPRQETETVDDASGEGEPRATGPQNLGRLT